MIVTGIIPAIYLIMLRYNYSDWYRCENCPWG